MQKNKHWMKRCALASAALLTACGASTRADAQSFGANSGTRWDTLTLSSSSCQL
jgi:hypothetical protein